MSQPNKTGKEEKEPDIVELGARKLLELEEDKRVAEIIALTAELIEKINQLDEKDIPHHVAAVIETIIKNTKISFGDAVQILANMLFKTQFESMISTELLTLMALSRARELDSLK